MAKRPVTIRFAIGRNTTKFNAGDSLGSRIMSDAIYKEAVDVALGRVKVRIDRMQNKLCSQLETGYTAATKFAADKMIGTASRGMAPVNIMDMMTSAQGSGTIERGLSGGKGKNAAQAFLQSMAMPRNRAGGSINWAPLSKRMVLTQHGMTSGNPPGPGKFFLNTGGLRATLRSFGRAMVKRTGIVRVRQIDKGVEKNIKPGMKEIQISRLRITLMPNVYPSHLPGLRSGNLGEFDPDVKFEKSLGLSSHMLEQLYGPDRHRDPNRDKHRPLLQPVMTYWTLFNIPNKIANVLQRAVINKSSTND